MQKEVDNIIKMNLKNDEKFKKLRKLFTENNVKYFSDFDDTITSNECLFYSKDKFIGKENYKKNLECILQDFEINKDFIEIINKKNIDKIVVITRNTHKLIKIFTEKYKEEILRKYNFEIIGYIGIEDNFKFKSEDKIKMMNKEGILITDMFEYKSLKNNKNVIFIEEYNILNYGKKLTKKVCLLLKFIIKRK